MARRPFQRGCGPSELSLGIRIAMPSATERLWPAHKFQGFLGEAATTSQLPLEKVDDFSFFPDGKLSPTNAKDEKSRAEVEEK